MDLHQFKLKLNISGNGCVVEMDGVPLRARAITVRCVAGDLTTVTVEFPVERVEIEGGGVLIDATCLGDQVKTLRELEASGG